jgi:HK97 family phage prohead protease
MTSRYTATLEQPGPDDNREAGTVGDPFYPARVRPYTLELRDVQAVGRPYRYLEGRAVPYDTEENVGWYVESHQAGSMDRTTKGGSGRHAPLLLFHDNRSFPIGVAESWSHDGGLDGVWKLDDSVDAQRAAKQADEGMLKGLSIGFQPVRSDWSFVEDWAPELGANHMDHVVRVESRLLEVSLTPTPAFQAAQVSDVRGLAVYARDARTRLLSTAAELDEWRQWAETAKLRSPVS